MKPRLDLQWGSSLRAWFVGAALVGWAASAAAQPTTLAIQKNNNQVAISWPAALGLVQPEKSTNLAANAWQDLGVATASASLTESVAAAAGFYRLRFLAPSISSQPQGQSVVVGGNVALNVVVTGTAPFTYQWRKNGTNLSGQISAALGLTNVTAADAGNYNARIANQVGAVTSVVATVTVGNPLRPPQGIYMGNFVVQTNTGGFAAMVNSNDVAVVLGYNIAQSESLVATNLTIAPDGTFGVTTDKSGKVTGSFGGDAVSGTLLSTNGITSTLNGTRKPDTGIQQSNVGYYIGAFGGLLTGNASFVLAADGTAFVYVSSPVLGGGGTFGAIDKSNNLSATTSYTLPGTTAPATIQLSGSLNPVSHQFAGTYSLGVFTLGTFNLTRVSTP